MIAAFVHLWSVPRLEDIVSAPEPKPYRAPLFIGDVALPRGGTTEFHQQWRQAEARRQDMMGNDQG